jgi:hypothetical protein
MSPIHRSHLIRRMAGVLTGLGALLAPITTGSAAFASPSQADPPAWFRRLSVPVHRPPVPPGWNKHPPLPGPVHVRAALAAGMPGWQITLIAAGAAVLAVSLAVLLARARAARRRPEAHQAGRPGRDGLAERSIQDVTAAANMAAGDQLAWPEHRSRPAGGGRWAVHPPSAVHPLPAKPGRILGQPHGRADGAPAMVPVLLPRTGPRPLRHDPLR